MPAWITPLFAPVWPVAGWVARSSTTAFRSGRRRVSSRATARPTMPPPITARSHSAGGAAVDISEGLAVAIYIDHPTDHLRKACAGPALDSPGRGRPGHPRVGIRARDARRPG